MRYILNFFSLSFHVCVCVCFNFSNLSPLSHAMHTFSLLLCPTRLLLLFYLHSLLFSRHISSIFSISFLFLFFSILYFLSFFLIFLTFLVFQSSSPLFSHIKCPKAFLLNFSYRFSTTCPQYFFVLLDPIPFSGTCFKTGFSCFSVRTKMERGISRVTENKFLVHQARCLCYNIFLFVTPWLFSGYSNICG